MDIGEKIAHYRTMMNMTQVQVAKALGITRSAINSWEMGQSTPQLKHVVALCNVFGVSIDTLVSDDDTKMMVDISSLNCEEQAIVLQLVRCLSGKNNSIE